MTGPSRRRPGWSVLLALTGVVALTACGADASAPSPPPAATSSPQFPPAPTGTERGALTSQNPVAAIDEAITNLGATATRVLYRSTSGVDGAGTEVVGTVFTPAGPAPEGGWPVVTVGHGTTGVTDDCAPSASPTLSGTTGLVAPLLQAGYVVTVSDYQGLGTDGPHPYLEPVTAAYNLIDAVRAARNVVPTASTRWAAVGISQGGQASWAAAEHADDYGDGLEFFGSANLSPAADLSAIMDDGTAAPLSLPQKMFLPYLLEGLSVLHPELDPADYMRGVLADNPEVTLSCVTARLSEKWTVATQLTPADTGPRTAAAAERMNGWLEDTALPRERAEGPMLVVVGERDNLILPQWTSEAVDKACEQGDVIEFESRPGEGHADGRAVPGAVQWIADRFAGVPAPNTCGEGGTP
ncbi:lipase family protein [Rhodococcus tibetensis]|uniref:Lipase family protein n=1 Tax=Rhodococcus tibetensis TaxID=2965064 RepID=A0ABT1Q719_9NOCA|nr:lipase family protein [Rhodococcus sp. FXJ9.536]MCQ4118036.1 lipase family protein [Rhodococcus sp. FXJ9.536]